MMNVYEDIRGDLDTGDIVLFSGKGGLSAGIKCVTRSKWSHVGMVLRLPQWDAVMLWESTTLGNVADIESGVERKGVQLVPLSERIRKYGGEVSVRLLRVGRTLEMMEALSRLRKEFKRRPYEQSLIELIRSAYDGPFGANSEDLSSLFCSEMVAEAWQRIGVLGEEKPSNEYTPHDFSDGGRLALLRGELSEEILIKSSKERYHGSVLHPQLKMDNTGRRGPCLVGA